jgi:hypothetical protein
MEPKSRNSGMKAAGRSRIDSQPSTISYSLLFFSMPQKSESPVLIQQIDEMIHTIPGVRVMLDRDLAQIYGVPTFRFNEAIKRNPESFRGFRLISCSSLPEPSSISSRRSLRNHRKLR